MKKLFCVESTHAHNALCALCVIGWKCLHQSRFSHILNIVEINTGHPNGELDRERERAELNGNTLDVAAAAAAIDNDVSIDDFCEYLFIYLSVWFP